MEGFKAGKTSLKQVEMEELGDVAGKTLLHLQCPYADRDADFSHKAYEWNHSIGDVVTALISAGMKLEFLREFPFSAYDALHFPVEQIGPDQYALPGSPGTIPFMYSIRATG